MSEIYYWFETRNTIPNAPRGHEDELLSGGRFIVVFAALSNREYVGSEDGADGFGRRATRRVRFTIGLKQKNTISNAPPGCKVKLLSCRQFKEIHPKQQRQTKSKQGHNEPMRTHSNHNANIKISTIKSTNHTNMQ